MFGNSALAALILAAMSAVGATPAAAQVAVVSSDAAVARFYYARQNAPLWFRAGSNSEAATQLVSILRSADVDGYSAGPQLAGQVEAAILAAQSGDKAKIMAAERLLSSAWANYVQAIYSPTTGMLYGYQLSRVPNPDRILYEAANAPSLTQHLQLISSVNPIYAQLRAAALAQPAGMGPDPRLLANMDRARSIPRNGRFVLVDAASARLWMYENGQPVDSMKVIVGTIETPTPMLASMIHYATLNPYWNVPENLIRKTVAPGAVKNGEAYLKAQGYQVMSDWTANATVIPGDQIDWKAVAAGQKIIRVRQLPGPTNAMGKLKFSFPNSQDIFLHDTPAREHFAKAQRTISNGCIRLEDAKRFARWLLGREPEAMGTDPEQFVKLPQGVPVYVTYLTAFPSEGKIVFADDVYGLDMKASRIASRAPFPTVEGANPPQAAR